MRQDLTDITLVVDRSGSMASVQDDATGGINSLIKEQKKAEGEARLTLVQFDTVYEFVHNGVNINDVPPYSLVPRGGTALLDAVGRAIVEVGERLSKLPEDQRPANVVFVIVTDGGENSSKEYSAHSGGYKKIADMIKHQQDVYNWTFQFIGSDATTFETGAAMGVDQANVAMYAAAAPQAAYSVASSKMRNMRSASLAGASQADLKSAMNFTEDERQAMMQSSPVSSATKSASSQNP